MPPQREIFRHTASATPAPSAPCSAAVSSIATRTATRSRTSRTASQAVGRLLDQLEARRGERLDRAHRLLHAPTRRWRPGAARRAGRPRRAPPPRGRRRRRRPPSASRTRSPRAPRAPACSAAPARSSAVDGRVDRHRRGGRVGEQRRDRPARAAPGAIPQREVDRRERRRQHRRRARQRVEQLGAPFMPLAARAPAPAR